MPGGSPPPSRRAARGSTSTTSPPRRTPTTASAGPRSSAFAWKSCPRPRRSPPGSPVGCTPKTARSTRSVGASCWRGVSRGASARSGSPARTAAGSPSPSSARSWSVARTGPPATSSGSCSISRSAAASRISSAKPRRWRRWGASLAASPTTSTISSRSSTPSAASCSAPSSPAELGIAVTLLGTVVERGPDGAASHVVGVMLDLTERRRLEDQLRQAQKMEAVGRLAGGVAHDFNNLLTVIYTFGGFVLGSLEPGSAIHADMQEVIKAAQRAASLTGQLLAFSRRQTIEPKIVNVDDSILEIEKLLRRVIGEDVGIVLQLQGQLGKVRIDPGAFEQVLLNLAINARDAMPSGGTLTVATSSRIVDAGHRTLSGEEIAPGTYVEVTVSDTGVGMTGEILE